MIRYVLTGFELELYSVHEFAYIYWYLYEFLYGWLLSSLSRAEACIAEAEATANCEKAGKKAAKNRAKGNKSKSKAYTKEILLIQAEQHLAGGYFKVSNLSSSCATFTCVTRLHKIVSLYGR